MIWISSPEHCSPACFRGFIPRPPGASVLLQRLSAFLLALLASCLAGCGMEQIAVYTAPKDKASAPARTAREDAPAVARPRPQVSWTLPKGWEATGAGQMSLASFNITGADGRAAQVSITQMGRLEGRDAVIMNMWREQLRLDPLSVEDVERQLQPVTVGGETGRLFQLEGIPQKTSNAVRIVTAVVHGSQASWFYKLAGDPPLVEAQKGAFLDFLKSIRIQEAAPAEVASDGTEARIRKPNWQVPSHWTELPAGPMQVAKFAVPPRGSAKAEVSVSFFPSDTGGTAANVNRWRRQLGLAEVQPGQAEAFVSAFDPANPEARLVDLENKDRRLLGAIVPRAGSYWFYKLVGDAEAVASEKDAFLRFAQSTP
jgi:hypothetical protein